MLFFCIKKLEGKAYDIQRVAQAKRFLPGKKKIALHFSGRHVQQEGNVIGFLPVARAAIGYIPLEDGVPCGAWVFATEFRKAQALQVLGDDLDGGAWPRLQLLRLAIDKVGGLCHSTIAFLEKLRAVLLDASAEKYALRHVLAGAGQMFFDLCSRLGDHVPMDVGKAVEGAPGVPCVIAFADLLVDPLLCLLFQKR